MSCNCANTRSGHYYVQSASSYSVGYTAYPQNKVKTCSPCDIPIIVTSQRSCTSTELSRFIPKLFITSTTLNQRFINPQAFIPPVSV